MGLGSFVTGPVVLLVSAFLYYRSPLLYTLYYNAPERLEKVNQLGKWEIRFQDVVRNCEDVYLHNQAGWALFSCDPGRDEWNTVMGTFTGHISPPSTGLYLYKYAEAPQTPPHKLALERPEAEKSDFHPLGIEYHAESSILFVANHAHSGSKIELYKLDVEEGTAALTAVLEDEKLATPNSIAAVSGTEFFVTNDHYVKARDNLPLAKFETYAGLPGGSVAHVKLVDGGAPQITTLARIPFANGISFLDSSTLAVASSTTASVWIYTIIKTPDEDSTVPTLLLSKKIPLSFVPDNISTDSDGKLLIAGHPHAPSLEKVSKNNRFCHGANVDNEKCQLKRLSWVAEWTEESGLKNLYVSDEFGTSSTAARDVSRKLGFATGLYERGVLVWHE
ncbi:hypothetical protein DOTSEDRAFT_85745 [Dothistroma septosporum NZE10]|uniref:Uncharacterized protein n=1 Tax=Dothistroma septosporum (strain NZE10 / CBS 128990) TaxID=675120 RepID=N1PW62_DOTSN|nr:hypothetical protein DOTSEDRAFT_85745 [Dothistroma septosporum NZE10]